MEFLIIEKKGVVGVNPSALILILLAPSLMKFLAERNIDTEDIKVYLKYLCMKKSMPMNFGINGSTKVCKVPNMEIIKSDQLHQLATHCPADTISELIIYQPLLTDMNGEYPELTKDEECLYKKIITEMKNMQVANKTIFIREDIRFDPENIPEKFIFNNKKRVTAIV